MGKFSRRALLFGTGAALGVYATKRYQAEMPSSDGTISLTPKGGDGVLNDASGLSETPIHKHIMLSEDPTDKMITALRLELRDAKSEGRPFCVGAARHSMGGQSIPTNGVAVTFDHNGLTPDTSASTYQVSAGTRWSSVINQLDPMGFSPKVMQSNNDFGVASTFCVNAHGWPVTFGPAGATVNSCRIMLADGQIVSASRTENPDLFNMSVGGYGLGGILIDLELEMVPNSLLQPTFEEMPSREFGQNFVKSLLPDVQMAYGRLNVDRERFFEDALMITYRPTEDQSDIPEASGSGVMSKLSRYIFRNQLGNERAKRWRWGVETGIGIKMAGEASRNSLINEPVVTLDDRDPTRTDILHEYFVPPHRFEEFIDVCKSIIPASYQELLNVTLRYIGADRDSILNYAPGHKIAAVMLFSQEMTKRGEGDMKRMTQELIDGVLSIGGTYYLPYRLHARQDQFEKAYARADEFAAWKRRYDPDLLFRNNLWDTYLANL